MTYHELSPELQEKVRANTIAYRIKAGDTKEDAEMYLNERIEGDDPLEAFFIFCHSPEGHGYWWDVMNGKIK